MGGSLRAAARPDLVRLPRAPIDRPMDLTLAARDGAKLAATLFEPAAPNGGAVLIDSVPASRASSMPPLPRTSRRAASPC